MPRKPARGATAAPSPRNTNRGRPSRRQPQNGASGATVNRILDGARRVLIEHGYAAFTTRRVAEAVGMTVGNLTYHFPSKRELLRALITKLLIDYSRRFEAFFFTDPTAPVGQELQTLVRWLFTDSITVETVHTFRELWALALHDAVIRRAVDDFYDDAMASVAQILQQARPNADARTISELVQLLAIISEGMTVFYGTRLERVAAHERLVELVMSLIGVIAPDLVAVEDRVENSEIRQASPTRRVQRTR